MAALPASNVYYTVGVAASPNGGALFVADWSNNKIRRVEVATGEVTMVAGSGAAGSADGVGDAAQFFYPGGITVSPDGSALFVAVSGNHKIQRVELATGEVTTISRAAAGVATRTAWATRRSSATQMASPSAQTAARCLWRTMRTTRSGGLRWRLAL